MENQPKPNFNRIDPQAGWADASSLPKGPNGRALCRFCSTEVKPPRRTFCSKICVTEWKIRTDPGFAKQKVFERDNGICALCWVDTLKPQTREKFRLNKYISRGARLSPWDMDHILPVSKGGGCCSLDNLRTLCKPCHKVETAKLAACRAAERKIKVG